eukprot:XP_024305056.1 uncharacterized protein LOC112268092 isoform X2 [Homo sapiens]
MPPPPPPPPPPLLGPPLGPGSAVLGTMVVLLTALLAAFSLLLQHIKHTARRGKRNRFVGDLLSVLRSQACEPWSYPGINSSKHDCQRIFQGPDELISDTDQGTPESPRT